MSRLALALALSLASPAAANDDPGFAAARVSAAQKAYETTHTAWSAGMGTLDDLYQWSVRWRESAAAAGDANADAHHLARMRTLHQGVQGRFEQGAASAVHLAATTYYVAEAEVWSRAPPSAE